MILKESSNFTCLLKESKDRARQTSLEIKFCNYGATTEKASLHGTQQLDLYLWRQTEDPLLMDFSDCVGSCWRSYSFRYPSTSLCRTECHQHFELDTETSKERLEFLQIRDDVVFPTNSYQQINGGILNKLQFL